jgi:hypothetical protein
MGILVRFQNAAGTSKIVMAVKERFGSGDKNANQ